MPEFNSHLDFFELLSLIRCGRNSAYETGLTMFVAFCFPSFTLLRLSSLGNNTLKRVINGSTKVKDKACSAINAQILSSTFANWLLFHIACIDKLVPQVFLFDQ